MNELAQRLCLMAGGDQDPLDSPWSAAVRISPHRERNAQFRFHLGALLVPSPAASRRGRRPALGLYYGMLSALCHPRHSGVGLNSLARGYREARFFLMAFTILLIGVAMYAPKTYHFLPRNLVTEYSLQIGSSLQMIRPLIALFTKRSPKDVIGLSLPKALNQ
jgi:hypothetical protein